MDSCTFFISFLLVPSHICTAENERTDFLANPTDIIFPVSTYFCPYYDLIPLPRHPNHKLRERDWGSLPVSCTFNFKLIFLNIYTNLWFQDLNLFI